MTDTFGDLIRHYRKQAGWHQENLAERAGLADRSAISRAETGTAPVATARAIVRALAEAGELSRIDLKRLAAAYLEIDSAGASDPALRTIGVMLGGLTRPEFWARLMAAIETTISDSGLLSLLCQHDESLARQQAGLSLFEYAEGLAGIILSPVALLSDRRTRLRDDLARVLNRGVPIVFVDRRIETPLAIPFVGIDNHEAAYAATRHLLQAGHRRIAGLFGLGESPIQHDRRNAFRAALASYGIDPDPRLIAFAEERPVGQREAFTRQYGRRGIRRAVETMLALPPAERPTAFFTATHYVTVELFATLAKATPGGIVAAVPGHYSVVALDDKDRVDGTGLRLTRVPYPVDEVGRAAVQKLLALIDNPADPAALADTIICTDLVEPGETVAPAG